LASPPSPSAASAALALSLAAIVAIFRTKIGMIRTLAACSVAGILLHLLGAVR
jgi:chromate transporter